MDLRAFDVLCALIVALGIAVAAAAPYLDEPYPAVVVAAFATGALVFIYLTIRIKFAGVMKLTHLRLEEAEAAAAAHRQQTEKSFKEIEELGRGVQDQLAASNDRARRDLETLRKNVNDVITHINRQLEGFHGAVGEIKAEYGPALAALQKQAAAANQMYDDIRKQLQAVVDDFNSYVADEQRFRDVIQNRLADRVAYLEDFIREKRKSLQI